jgi:hypothetical protein
MNVDVAWDSDEGERLSTKLHELVAGLDVTFDELDISRRGVTLVEFGGPIGDLEILANRHAGDDFDAFRELITSIKE